MATDLLKIFTVSLMSAQKHKAYAAFNGEQLVIGDVQPITGFFGSWKDALIKEVQEKTAEGYVVLVEELTDNISQYASQYLLEDMSDIDSRTNLYSALDQYFALSDVGNILFHNEVQKYVISAGAEGSKVEKKQDEKGRTVYSVDWRGFHGGYRAVLLCVVAAMNEPISERYIKEMLPAVELNESTHPLDRFKRVLHNHDLQQAREFEEKRSGKP